MFMVVNILFFILNISLITFNVIVLTKKLEKKEQTFPTVNRRKRWEKKLDKVLEATRRFNEFN